MTIYSSFVDEIEKIAIPGKPLGRIFPKPGKYVENAKLYRSMGKHDAALKSLDAAGVAAGERAELAHGLSGARSVFGKATARSYLATIRAQAGLGRSASEKGRPKAVVRAINKGSVKAGDMAFKNQSKKEMERGIRKGEV